MARTRVYVDEFDSLLRHSPESMPVNASRPAMLSRRRSANPASARVKSIQHHEIWNAHVQISW